MTCIPTMKTHIEAALSELPYREDVEPGTQAMRDWLKVQRLLSQTKTQLNTMERQASR